MGLSKSKIIAHRQCPKRLWLEMNQPSLAIYSESTEMNFQVGNRVGEVARELFPEGSLIDGYVIEDVIPATQAAISDAKPFFEGAFLHDEVLIRADLLLPRQSAYDLVEVKSSTRVKDVHVEDAAIQSWVVKGAGLPLSHTRIAHIDTSFVYAGDGNYDGLFEFADITAEVTELIEVVPEWVKQSKQTLAGDIPSVEPGDQCYAPYDCPYQGHCIGVEELVEGVYSPMVLPYRDGKALAAELIEEGYDNLCDVPEDRLCKPKHQRIHRVSRSGVAELDDEAGNTLAELDYPRYFIDFETINPAVPLWADTRPYQQIPFQWSCHIEHEDGSITHEEFLADGDQDPRRLFAQSLIETVGLEGPIFVYNAGFERSRVRELSQKYNDLSQSLDALNERVVDLLPIAREHYYHPDMRGSWSIKAVLPTVAPELAYSDLEVGDGGMAMNAFAEMMEPGCDKQKNEELRRALLEYCSLDTLAMVKLAHYFEGKNEDAESKTQ